MAEIAGAWVVIVRYRFGTKVMVFGLLWIVLVGRRFGRRASSLVVGEGVGARWEGGSVDFVAPGHCQEVDMKGAVGSVGVG